jgi:hypothetical protein
MAYFEKYRVEFQEEGNGHIYIPVWSTCTFRKMRLITSITGKDVCVFIRVRVVKERTVEEIDEGLKKATESFNKLHCLTPSGTKVASTEPCRDNQTRIEETAQPLQKEVASIQSKNIKEEERRRKIEQRKKIQEQTAKENRRIFIIIIIAILGLVILINAKCAKTRSNHHYDLFDPSMEYRHT